MGKKGTMYSFRKRPISEAHRRVLRALIAHYAGIGRAAKALGLGVYTVEAMAAGGLVMMSTAERAEAAIDAHGPIAVGGPAA